MISVDATGALAGEVRDAVLGVPGVARLAPGSAVEVATQFAGGKVVGVRLAGPVVEVHVVVDALPIGPVADQVQGAAGRVLTAAGDPRPVRVVVTDVDDAAFTALTAPGAGAATAVRGAATAGSGAVPAPAGTVGR